MKTDYHSLTSHPSTINLKVDKVKVVTNPSSTSYNLTSTGKIAGCEKLPGGLMGLPKGDGLGVEPDWETLGKPILSIQ